MEGMTGLLGPAVMIGLAAIGGGAAIVTLRASFSAHVAETQRRFSEYGAEIRARFAESEADRKELRGRLETVDRETVKRQEFDRFDDRIAGRFEKLEHAVNNGALKTAEIIKNALRDILPSRGQA